MPRRMINKKALIILIVLLGAVLAGGTAETNTTRCEIQIHSVPKPAPDRAVKRSSWCIVTLPEPPVANGGYDRELASLACLF